MVAWLLFALATPEARPKSGQHSLPYVHEGQTVFEPGPGMGYFTLELARLVGASGRVLAVDIQPKMLERLSRRASKAGLLERIHARLATADSMGLGEFAGSVDFTLAFAAVHELPDTSRFFGRRRRFPSLPLPFFWRNRRATSRNRRFNVN